MRPMADPGVGTEHAEYMVSDTAVFIFRGETVSSRELSRGTAVEIPIRLFPVVHHFNTPQPIFSAFMVPTDGGALDDAEVFTLVRELIESGILVPKRPARAEPRTDGQDRHAEIWSSWGASLLYYLDSRTLEDHPYYDAEAGNQVLVGRAQRRLAPSSYKDYPMCPFAPLEEPSLCLQHASRLDRFLDVLLRRRTCRAYTGEPLTRAELSALLYLTWGATSAGRNDLGEDVFLKKTSPSGGSLHSAEVYPIVMNVDGVKRGVYHYSVRRHGLELLSQEDPSAWIGEAAGGQAWVAEAAVLFLTTSILYRMAWKYQSPRTLRVVLLDIGHLSQTFYLSATWLGLGSFATAALRDESFERKLGLDYLAEPVLLLSGVGHPDHHPGGCERPRQRPRQ